MSRRPLDLTDPGTVRAVTRRAGLRRQHHLGQNFLVDREVLEFLVDALELGSGDQVLEIGMGIGTLTAELARRAARVVAVEIDPSCIRAARITLHQFANVEIVEADAMRCTPGGLGLGPGWLAAGNIPYQMTGALLNHLYESPSPPSRGAFLVQREVARRLAAPAGDWSLATVALRSLASIEHLRDVPPTSFDPEPAVTSAVIRVRPRPALTPAERASVLALSRTVFQMRRKTLRHGVARALGGDTAASERALAAADLDAGRRPGTLTLGEWLALARCVAAEDRHG